MAADQRFQQLHQSQQSRVCRRHSLDLLRGLVFDAQGNLDLAFPELKDAFEDPSCDTALAVLRIAPSASLARHKRVTTLAVARAPGGRRRLDMTKAAVLKALAERSVAAPELEEQAALEIQLLIGQYDLLGAQIEQAETRVAALLDGDVARRLQTIPGVGPATAATLMAEIGDIWRFDDVDQLLAYAGVHPHEVSSGKKGSNPETSWRMGQDGERTLAGCAVSHGPGGHAPQPHHRRSLPAQAGRRQVEDECARPLHEQVALNLVWGVWRGNQDFDPGHQRLTRPYGT